MQFTALAVLPVRLGFCLLLTMVPFVHAVGGQPAPAIRLNLQAVDLRIVAAWMGQQLTKPVLIDERLQGEITLTTPRAVNRHHAMNLLRAALRMQGIVVLETSADLRLLPEAETRQHSQVIHSGRLDPRSNADDQVVTRTVTLRQESASNLMPVLKPLLSGAGSISPMPGSNRLIVTDYSSNLRRIEEVIDQLDRTDPGEVQILPVQHAQAGEMAVLLSSLISEGQSPATSGVLDSGQRSLILADVATNTLVLRSASPDRIAQMRSLLARLDQPTTADGIYHVVHLRNAQASQLLAPLRAVMGLRTETQPISGSPGISAPATAASTGSATAATATAGAPGPTVTISADPLTNSLIIRAPEPVARTMRSVIDRLDVRRAQVQIEALIVELQSDRMMEVGLQFQMMGGLLLSNTLARRGSGASIGEVQANPTGAAGGLNLGITVGTVSAGDREMLTLPVLARALENEANARVLSTPSLLTLDNEEARVVIGQNVPFVTGQFNAQAGGAAANPFQTVERRDVGTILRVRPQISESGAVRMQISQEVSTVQDRTLQAGLITNRRAIESHVLVDDGQIVVLGGLIERRTEGDVQQVPGLSNLPVIGRLFRYDTRKQSRTQLLVFLRPTVFRDGAELAAQGRSQHSNLPRSAGDLSERGQ